MKRIDKLLLCLLLLLLATTTLWGQGLFATLTGVVSDPSGAVVANAKVTLKNAESGDERNSATNSEGYYTFASVPVGTYILTVEAPGFQTFRQTNIGLGGGEKRNANASLTVGSTNQTVEVSGSADIITPEDSGEKSTVLTADQLQNYVQVGSNAAEYIKIVPGFANYAGTSNKASYTGQTIGINANGDAGSQSPLNNNFAYNGLPGNTLDIVADGAHVSDPGCNCDTPVNPNSEFVQEFRVLTSNFSAEEQKGPIVITSVTKAGGSQFHGSGFFQARNYELNSNDALNNASGAPKPQNKYYYPGATLGGPVIVPFTNFNKNRDKLFFFTGYEYFYQVLDTGLLRASVPTDNMRKGIFTPSEVASIGSPTSVGGAGYGPGQLSACVTSTVAVDPVSKKACNPAYSNIFPGGVVPNSWIDPSMQNLMKLYPSPNADPNTTGGYNYVQTSIFNQNNVQWTVRGDWNISDNTKVFVRYNLQRETQLFPVGLWWRQSDQVPYPSSVEGKNRSDSITGTITHVFSPTMTNETVFAYTFVGFPNVFSNPSAVDRSKVGYADPTLFAHTNVPQIPSFGGTGGNGEAALVFNPGGFEAGGASSGLYANKYMPSVSDTLTKVWGTHTIKGGFFYEWIRNAQPANNNTNGYLVFNAQSSDNTTTFGNSYADMLTGNLFQYSETNKNRINDIAYSTYEFFGQDAWKVTPRLTLEYGLRFTHFTPWVDRLGYGFSIFNPASYAPSCAGAPNFCGFEWHGKNASVPLGGYPTRALYYQPRFGLAYDISGNGRTVIRGGWGRFYYHSGQFTNGLDASAGVTSISLNTKSLGTDANKFNIPIFARNLNPSIAQASPSAPAAVDRTDDRQPYTDSWSFTISRRIPWASLVEISYVGNSSRDLQNFGGYGSNINLVPLGAMFKDPNPATADPDNYRPYKGYKDINQITNNLYSNYNGLQLSLAHQQGRVTFQANYTFSKALGIVNPSGVQLNQGGATLDPFNLNNNYGVLPNNRTHVFNLAYSVNLGSPIRQNLIARGLINGWQLSGIIQLQSGANLTYNTGGDNYGFNAKGITNATQLGTNAVQLNPLLTCDPTKNLKENQYINGACFAIPGVGQNGPTLLPVIYGPGFFDADMGLFKNFQLSESRKLQFRIQAYNFLNHPNWSFNGNHLGLNYDESGKLTDPLFGFVTQKQGNRIVELEAKFYF